jgi:hypothetical protein
MDKSVHKLVQRRRKGDSHVGMVIHSLILSRPGLLLQSARRFRVR